VSKISDIQDHGSIVLVSLDDRPEAVAFDARSFREMADARGGDLRGECHLEFSEDGPPVLVFAQPPTGTPGR